MAPVAKTPIQKAKQLANAPANLAKVRARHSTTTMAGAALVPADKPLTEQQKKFAKAYAQGETIPNAMARAGYNEQPSYGFRMVKMPNILAVIEKERALFAEQNKLKRQDVFDMLKDAFDTAKLMSEPASMVAAAREIGKMAGFYEPVKKVIDINVRTGTMAELAARSDEELVAMVDAAARSIAAAQQLALDNEPDEDEDEDTP